jgi:catechol 2,3-dioxygenase-like lactoylglutathione lyase family enzyme
MKLCHLGRILAFGHQSIELTIPAKPGAPYPADSTAADLWFQHFAIAVADIAAANTRLQRFHPAAITIGGPVRLPASSGGATALKFRDPDGHPLELIAGLRDSGGIDHSAISVADADHSIAFYTGLGLRLGTRQRNKGPKQDRLDGLAGVAVDVVALLPETPTPHVELLAYRSPRGRLAALQADDIAATRLVFAADVTAPITLRDPDGHWIEGVPAGP